MSQEENKGECRLLLRRELKLFSFGGDVARTAVASRLQANTLKSSESLKPTRLRKR